MRALYSPDASLDTVRTLCPWAARILKVSRGWMAFESSGEAETWLRNRQRFQRDLAQRAAAYSVSTPQAGGTLCNVQS